MGQLMRISSSQMKNEADEIREQVVEAVRQTEELQTAMQSLSAVWSGPAWSAYQKRVNEDILAMKALCVFVSDYAGKTEQAASLYDDCENKVYDLFH